MRENFSKRDALNLVNVRAGVNIGDGWQLVGWSTNLTDENYFGEGFNPNGLIFYGKRRQYGFEVTKCFSHRPVHLLERTLVILSAIPQPRRIHQFQVAGTARKVSRSRSGCSAAVGGLAT